MQWMHQSYKCMKAQKETKWVCIQLACSRRPRALLRKPIIGIYKPSSIMKNSHQYMKVITQETLYHEDHGASLKHKVGKRIVALPLLSFLSFFFLFDGLLWPFLFGLLWPLLFFIKSGDSSRLVGKSLLPSSFPHMGQCSNNDDHHTFIYLQLDTRTKYDSI